MTTIKGKTASGETRIYFNCTGKSHFKDCKGTKVTNYAESLEDMIYSEISEKYRCAMHNNCGNIICTNKVTIDEKELLEEVKRYLLSIIDDRTAFAYNVMEQCEKSNEDVNVAHLNKAKENLEKRREKFKDMYAEGLIDIKELKKEFAATSEGLERIALELEGLKQTQNRTDNIDDIETYIEKILMQKQFTNEDMRAIIDRIIVSPDNSVEVYLK